MSWSLVPTSLKDWSFFDRQRDLFGSWIKEFEDDWRLMDLEASKRRFENELDDLRRNLFQLDNNASALEVERPFVTDAAGNKKLSLRFDCSQYKPEEITVKTVDGRLCVHAKHEEESEGGKVYREMSREYTLPKYVDHTKIKSTLSADGVLQIEGPAPQGVEAPKENLIPIEKC